MTRHTLVASFALLLLATQAFAQEEPYAGFLPNTGNTRPANVFSERGFMTPEGLRPYEQSATERFGTQLHARPAHTNYTTPDGVQHSATRGVRLSGEGVDVFRFQFANSEEAQRYAMRYAPIHDTGIVEVRGKQVLMISGERALADADRVRDAVWPGIKHAPGAPSLLAGIFDDSNLVDSRIPAGTHPELDHLLDSFVPATGEQRRTLDNGIEARAGVDEAGRRFLVQALPEANDRANRYADRLFDQSQRLGPGRAAPDMKTLTKPANTTTDASEMSTEEIIRRLEAQREQIRRQQEGASDRLKKIGG